jgi:hypothetical protein
MRALHAMFAMSLLAAGAAQATDRYTDARILEIETGVQQIHLFLEVLGGDAPPLGNGGTNLLPNRPYLMLANTAAEIAERKHMYAAALAAHAAGAIVRIRWDDAAVTPNRVEFFLVRN